MIKRPFTLYVLALSLVGGLTNAADFGEAANHLCDKMKTCAQQKMQGQGMTQEMMGMMTQMVDQACASMQQQYNPTMELHALHESAIKCMNSMAQLDCAVLDQGNSTEECRQLEEMSKQYAQ